MSEGAPKQRHIWPPGNPEEKKEHFYTVLGITAEDAKDLEKLKTAYRKALKKYHPDLHNNSRAHYDVIEKAYAEGVARIEKRWDERKGEARPKETLQTLRTEQLSTEAGLRSERKKVNSDPLKIQQYEESLRLIAARMRALEAEEARVADIENRARQETAEAGEREREAAKAAEERERLERVEAARKREEEEAAAAEQPEINDQTPEEAQVEAEDTQPKEEEPVVTGTSVVPYEERDAEVVPQGEVIDHPIEPPGTDVVTVQESPEEEPAREPGTAVVVAESSSGDIVPASAETPVHGGGVVPYKEDEYFPLAAAGGGGGEGGGDDDEDAAHDHPEGHGPHHAHGHDAHHGGHHGHGDHGHGSHDSGHGAGGHGSHGHAEEKKKGLFGAWWSFFGSLFAFGGETIKGFGTFFGKGGGGGGGGESHGHH